MMNTDTEFPLAEDDYVLLFWFFNLPQTALKPADLGGDMMGFAYRSATRPRAGWFLRWRFRYYRDAKAFASADERNWFGGDLGPVSEDKVEAAVRRFLDAITVAAAGPQFRTVIDVDVFHVRGTHERLAELVRAGQGPEWMHMQPETA